MCIPIVDEKSKKTTVGWKLFTVGDYGLEPPYAREFYMFKTFKVNRWIADKGNYDIEPVLKLGTPYLTGFHFYRRKKAAIKDLRILYYETSKPLTMRKIKVRNVTATGKSHGFLSVSDLACAREIFIERR
jgi:hypothetical protein